MIVHPRTVIRAYAWDLLKDAVDVGGRVYLSEPNPIIFDRLPVVAIYFLNEPIEISAGDRYIAREYERKLNLAIDIIAEQQVDPDGALKVENLLDGLGRQVELAMFNDNFFWKRLTTYTGENSDPGLLQSSILVNTTPHAVKTDSEKILAAQRLDFELTYLDNVFVEHKADIIESYMMEIRRVGWDESTVDPVLIAAEGDF